MSGEGVATDIAAMKEHATGISRSGDEIAAIGREASSTNLGMDVFGICGQPFAKLIQVFMHKIGDSIQDLAKATDDSGTGLNDAADHYDRQETTNSGELDGVY